MPHHLQHVPGSRCSVLDMCCSLCSGPDGHGGPGRPGGPPQPTPARVAELRVLPRSGRGGAGGGGPLQRWGSLCLQVPLGFLGALFCSRGPQPCSSVPHPSPAPQPCPQPCLTPACVQGDAVAGLECSASLLCWPWCAQMRQVVGVPGHGHCRRHAWADGCSQRPAGQASAQSPVSPVPVAHLPQSRLLPLLMARARAQPDLIRVLMGHTVKRWVSCCGGDEESKRKLCALGTAPVRLRARCGRTVGVTV